MKILLEICLVLTICILLCKAMSWMSRLWDREGKNDREKAAHEMDKEAAKELERALLGLRKNKEVENDEGRKD